MSTTTSQGVETVVNQNTTDQTAPPAVQTRQFWGNEVKIDAQGRAADGKSAKIIAQMIVILNVLGMTRAAGSAAEEEGLVLDLSNPGNQLELLAIARKSSNFTFSIPLSDNPNDGVVSTNLPGLVSKPTRTLVRKGLAAHK